MDEPPVEDDTNDDFPTLVGDTRTPWVIEPWWMSDPEARGSYREWWNYVSTTTIDHGDGTTETYTEEGGYETTIDLGGSGAPPNGDDDPDDQPTDDVPTDANAAPVAVNDIALPPVLGAFSIDVLPNDFDPDGDQLTIVSLGLPGQGTATHDGTSVQFTPEAGAAGVDAFTYTIHDGRGGFATATVTVTFAAAGPPADEPPLDDEPPTDDTPVDDDTDDGATWPVTNGPVTIIAGSSVKVLTGIDLAGGVEIIEVAQPFSGAVVNNGDGSLTYTPDAGFLGVDVFTWTLRWPHGGTAKTTMVVTVVPAG